MKTSEIKKEAYGIIKDIFPAVTSSDNKDDWKKALGFIDKKIYELENGERGSTMFIWRKVKSSMIHKFGQKFIAQ